MNVKLSNEWIQSNSELVFWPNIGLSNSKRMHQCRRNVVMLPIEKYKSSFNIQHADVVDIKFFVTFFATNNGLTVKLSMKVIQSNSKLAL